VVFLAAPKSCYKDCGKLWCCAVLEVVLTWETPVDVGGGWTIHAAESAKYAILEVYLGSLLYIAMDPTDRMCLRASSLTGVHLGAYGGASSCGGT
jgi:hypothetical protein